jgi:non-ribosomal peptide synthase protein (TIGR01720 family)
VSLRIILEDLELSYKQAERETEIELPLKTTPFKEWVEKLYRYSSGEKLLEELLYWKKVEETHTEPLPKNRTARENRIGNTHWLTFKLSKEYTGKLLKEVNKAYNTEINDILLTGLALALNQWAGLETVAIHMEGHGREEIIDGVDITRTVGWFTSLYPVVIDVRNAADISLVVKNTKEILRAVPNKGIGYGILKYLTPADKKQGVTFKLKPEIGFNYLGQFNNDLRTDLFSPADISPGNSISPALEREYALDVMGLIPTDELEIMIAYNKEEFDEENISILSQAYERSLKKIIDHCAAKEETESTASDYTSSDFDEAELDSIAEELEESFNA